MGKFSEYIYKDKLDSIGKDGKGYTQVLNCVYQWVKDGKINKDQMLEMVLSINSIWTSDFRFGQRTLKNDPS